MPSTTRSSAWLVSTSTRDGFDDADVALAPGWSRSGGFPGTNDGEDRKEARSSVEEDETEAGAVLEGRHLPRLLRSQQRAGKAPQETSSFVDLHRLNKGS